MNLAAILGFYFLSLGSLLSPARGFSAEPVPATASNAARGQDGARSSSTPSSNISLSQPPTAPGQNPIPAQPPPVQGSMKPNHISAKPHARAKKAIYHDCSNAPTPLNPVLTAKKVARSDSASSAGDNNGIANGDSAKSATPASSSHSKPCPPPKKVVRNGGADEPKIELLGGSPSDQASSERSTEQITAATEDNLKKIAERQLNSGDKETVSQIRQFIEESKQAVAAGDPERARNLAMKARLLSQELVSP